MKKEKAKAEKEVSLKEKQEEKIKNPVVARGRTFEGIVIKKFPKRVVIESERTIFVKKYDRFYKKKTKIHSRIPENSDIEIGEYIKVKECRPLSKIIHSVFIEKIKPHNIGDKK